VGLINNQSGSFHNPTPGVLTPRNAKQTFEIGQLSSRAEHLVNASRDSLSN